MDICIESEQLAHATVEVGKSKICRAGQGRLEVQACVDVSVLSPETTGQDSRLAGVCLLGLIFVCGYWCFHVASFFSSKTRIYEAKRKPREQAKCHLVDPEVPICLHLFVLYLTSRDFSFT